MPLNKLFTHPALISHCKTENFYVNSHRYNSEL